MTYNAYITLRNSDTVLFDLEEDYLRSEDGLIYIGNHYIVSASEFVSVEFIVQDEELAAEGDVDNSSDRVKEIADLVREELLKDGRVAIKGTGVRLPEPAPFDGGISIEPNGWYIGDHKIASPAITYKGVEINSPASMDIPDLAKQVSRELAFQEDKNEEIPKTSLERAVEERRRGAY